MTSVDEIVEAKLAEGCEFLDRIVILRMRELALTAGDLVDRPRIREFIDGEHERMLAWRESKLAEIESALRAAAGA